MDAEVLVNLGLLIVILAAIGFGLRRLWPAIAGHFIAGPQGWSDLAKVYGTSGPPQGALMQGQTLMIGRVVYRRSVGVALGDEGFYLEKGFPLSALGQSRLLIPWREIREIVEARLFWEKAPCLVIGDPPVASIIVRPLLFDAIRPWLARTGLLGLAKDNVATEAASAHSR
jgi:hypothetical protein